MGGRSGRIHAGPPQRVVNFLNLLKLLAAFKNYNFAHTREEGQATHKFTCEIKAFIEADAELFATAIQAFAHLILSLIHI